MFAAKELATSQYEAIFVFAFEGIILTIFYIGEESIGPSFLPVFMKEMKESGEKKAWDFANVLLTLQLLILLLVAAGLICFPDQIINTFTTWADDRKPEEYNLARRSLMWLAPCIVFLSLGSTTYMLLNGYKKFFLAAFGDASTKICVVVSLIGGVGIFGLSYKALFWGLLVGSAAKLLTHLLGLLWKLRFWRPSLRVNNPALKTMFLLMLPLLAGIFCSKARDLVNNLFVLSSLDESGVLQANSLGRKLSSSINMLVPYALAIAMLPFFCELVERNKRQRLGEMLTNSSRMLLACFLPGVALLAALAESMAITLFLFGKMRFQIAVWTGISTACYLMVLPAAAVECVLMQGYFANRKMISVSVIGILCSLLSIVISLAVVMYLKVSAIWALATVSLGFALTRYIKSLVLVVVLKRTVPMFPLKPTMLFLGKVFVLAVVTGGVTWVCARGLARTLNNGVAQAKIELRAIPDGQVSKAQEASFKRQISKARIIAGSLVSGVAGGLVFLLGAWLLGIKEPYTMLKWALDKLRGKLPKQDISPIEPGAG